MAKKQIKLAFSMSYGEMQATASEKQVFLTRDVTELTPRGVTSARLTAYQGLITAFNNTVEDIVMKALVEQAKQAKNAKKQDLKIAARDIMSIARDGFGEKSGQYKSFGYTGYARLDDASLLLRSETLADQAATYQTALASKVLTTGMVSAFRTLISEFNTLKLAIATAESNRSLNTEAHRKAANNVYLEMKALCQTAAGYYLDRDFAKHEDYIIYENKGMQTRNGTVQPGLTEYRELVALQPAAVFSLRVDSGSPLEFYYSQTEGGLPGTNMVTVQPNPNNYSTHPPEALGYSPETGFVKFNIRNPGSTQSSIYRVRVQ